MAVKNMMFSGVVVNDNSGATIQGASIVFYDINAGKTVTLTSTPVSDGNGRFSATVGLNVDAANNSFHYYIVAKKTGFTAKVTNRWAPGTQTQSNVVVKLIEGL